MTNEERARLYGRVIYYYALSMHRDSHPQRERVTMGASTLGKLLERPEAWILRHMETVVRHMPDRPIRIQWRNGRLTSSLAQECETSADVRRVHAYYCETMGRSVRLSPKLTRLIQARLRCASADDLCEAILGNSRSPYHSGENEQGVVYNSLELIMRSDDKVHYFRQFAARPDADSGDVFDRLQVIYGGRS